MKLMELQNKDRPFWMLQDIARTLNISEASARVLASRYAQKKWLTRFKNNFYILTNQLPRLTQENLFYISNLIQTPSYISLGTALGFWGATTQLTQGVIEAISSVRTSRFEAAGISFWYRKISPKFYEGFERQNQFFIATPEKALLDALYLESLGRYALDKSSLDLSLFSKKNLRALSRRFPARTQVLLQSLLN